MTGERAERRLAAILAADIAGYSRLMGVDEEGTLRDLKAHRRALLDPKVAEYRGRIVKTTGDGALVEFQSVIDAVRFAIEMQRGMTARNEGVPQDRRIEFRIGIHQGDIIIDEGDIFGDGVNLAARLEGLASAGGICVSRTVRDEVRDKLGIAFDDLGEQRVKNIARPVRTFAVRLGEVAASVPASERPSLPLPDKPSIAVLPFANMSGDPEQDYFADGMVEDIITGLSRIKWLFVIARNSTFVYKGKAVDVKQIGRELGVRYLLEASVRKAGNQVRLTGQLIDTASATHVWAQRYDRALDDIFALQDELTMSVVGAIEPSLRQAEIELARRKRPDSLDAYDLYLRALPLVFTAMPEFSDETLPLLQQAVAIEPDYALAHAYIAWCHEQGYLRGGRHEETKSAGLRHARLAVATGGDDATALAVAGFVIGILERDYQTAFNAFDRAMALSPSSAQAFGFSSCIRAWAGDSTASVEQAETAIRLSPFDPLIFFPYNGLAYAHLFAGRFEEAANAASRAAQANPRFSIPCVLQAAALASLGRIDEAKANAERLLLLEPTFTIGSFVAVNFTSPDRLRMMAEALRQAGLPE
jgi:adenylate cyclase